MDGWTDDDLGSARGTGGCRRCNKESVQEEMKWLKFTGQTFPTKLERRNIRKVVKGEHK